MEDSPTDFAARRARLDEELNRRGLELLMAPVLEATDPDESVAFVFEVMHAARAFEYHVQRATAGRAMTAAQARFAWLLASSPWPTGSQDLEVTLGMSQAGVSRMVSRMRERGLVESSVSPGDARYVRVQLTDHGMHEWHLVLEKLREVTAELKAAAGPRSRTTFRPRLGRVTSLDERHARFEHLRDPFGFMA